MPYVMVPVPEDQVEEVMQFVLRSIARASTEPWEEESLAGFYGELDEPSRSLLSVIARAALAGRDLTETEAAGMIELTRRETLGIMREVNEMAREASRPLMILPRRVTNTLPNGRTQDIRVLSMDAEVARLVRDIERADLRSQPHPLGQEPLGS